VDSSVAITLEAGVGLGAIPIYRIGTEVRQRWLPDFCARRLGAFGFTEPGVGLDVRATIALARREDGWS
jgi:alkylation response protein AidB-like acyl-CoA dehydrogenase